MSPKAKDNKKPVAQKPKSRGRSVSKPSKPKELDEKDLQQISGGVIANRIKIW